MQKSDQRKDLKKRLNLFTNRKKVSEIICRTFIDMECYKQANSIFVYLSTEKEVDTSLIIKTAFEEGKRIFAPFIKDNKMLMSEIFPDTEYIKGEYNIAKPKNPVFSDIQTDIALIPLVGFDKNKNRLGQGKGYYDKFLSNYKGKKIAVAFSCQQVDNIVIENNDIKMDTIITEEKIF